LHGDGAVSLSARSAGAGAGATKGQLDVSAQGPLTIGAATSGGGQTFSSVGDLVFTHLTTTGIPGDPGNVDLTSTAGAVRGGDIDAHGGVTLRGQTVALHDLTATLGPVSLNSATTLTGAALSTGGAATLTAVGDINWTTFAVAGALGVSSSGGALTLGSAMSGGGQTFSSVGDLVFTRLTTTGIPGDPGNVDLTSTAGAVRGGDIDAHGGVTVNGQTVALHDLTATLGPVALNSATTLTGDALSTGGAASLTAAADINWTTFSVG